MARSLPSSSHVVLRVAAALGGGYGFTWGFIALAIATLFAAGMDFEDAQHLAAMIGFPVFAAAFLLAFSARSLPRVWATLVGGGVLMTVVASLVQSALVD